MQRSPLAAPTRSCRRWPRHRIHAAHGQAGVSRMRQGNDGRGSRFPNSVPRIAAAGSFGPPDARKRRRLLVTTVGHWTFLVGVPRLLSTSLPYFPTVRAGASNPGDDSRTNLAMRQRPGHRTFYYRRAKRLLSVDAVPCGLSAATMERSLSCEATPPCSSPKRLGLIFSETPMAAASISRRLLRIIRDLQPPPPRLAGFLAATVCKDSFISSSL